MMNYSRGPGGPPGTPGPPGAPNPGGGPKPAIDKSVFNHCD